MRLRVGLEREFVWRSSPEWEDQEQNDHEFDELQNERREEKAKSELGCFYPRSSLITRVPGKSSTTAGATSAPTAKVTTLKSTARFRPLLRRWLKISSHSPQGGKKSSKDSSERYEMHDPFRPPVSRVDNPAVRKNLAQWLWNLCFANIGFKIRAAPQQYRKETILKNLIGGFTDANRKSNPTTHRWGSGAFSYGVHSIPADLARRTATRPSHARSRLPKGHERPSGV